MNKNSYQIDTFRNAHYEIGLLEKRADNKIEEMLPLLKTSGLTPENRVLEVGAGTGKRALEIAKFVEHGEVVGIDISESLLKSASENPANKNRKNLSFQSADIMSKESLSPLGKFDFVYIRLLLQHLNDPLMA